MKPDTPSATPARAPGLERDRVVQTALELLDEVGLDGLTLRRLADKLGVKAAALYWHFHNKQDLINSMAIAMFHHDVPAERRRIPAGVSWQDIIRTIATHHRKAMFSHRDGARLISSAEFNDSAMFEGLERVLKALCAQGFTPELAFLCTIDVMRFTLGCVFEEQADPRTKEETLAMHQKNLPTIQDRYPLMAKTLSSLLEKRTGNSDGQFKHGLEVMVLGIEQKLQTEQAK
jgi:TetR/AcrR family transcriptional regulator, tetracycline repressor protein